MRRFGIRVFVGFLTFVTGLVVFGVSQRAGPRLRDCVVTFEERKTVAELEIASTVFRYNIEQLFFEAESPTFFLSEYDDRDAREEVVRRLQREGLPVRRLSQLGMNQRLHVDCEYCPKGPQSEFILRLGRIRWLNPNEVLVGGSCRRWYLNADRAYLYQVVLEGNRWVVKRYEYPAFGRTPNSSVTRSDSGKSAVSLQNVGVFNLMWLVSRSKRGIRSRCDECRRVRATGGEVFDCYYSTSHLVLA